MSLTLPWLEGRSRATPHAVALEDGERRLRWGQLADWVGRLAAALQREGVRPGDAVALLEESGAAWVALFHAVSACGAVLVPLGTRLTPAELSRPLASTPARWLVHGAGELEERAQQALGELPQTRALALAKLRRDAEATAARPALRSPPPADSPFAVVFTSGTSGPPKGAELGPDNLLWSAFGWAMQLGALPDDRWLACLPLSHVAGLGILTRSVLFGAAVHLERRFDPARVAHVLESEPITLVSFVPTMLQRLLEVWGERPAPASLRAVLLGGGPIPEALIERGLAGGWPLAPTYGLTEAASHVTTLPPSACAAGRGTGRPPPGTRLRVVDAEGIPQPPGAVGAIEVAGPTVMRGYRGDPEASAAVLRGGWLRTGDIGRLDDAGHLHVLARRSDLVLSGGENVYPVEVESALLEHPAVAEAGVAPLPDAELGQRVAAWIVLRPGAEADAESLRRFCRERLAGFKLPRTIRFVSSLPRGASGKLLRSALPRLSPGGKSRAQARGA